MNPPPPDVDCSRLVQIGAIEDPAVSEILDSFIEALDLRIDGLAAAADEKELPSLHHLLHQLRGSAVNCGFSAIADLCLRIESGRVDFSPEDFRLLSSRAKAAWHEAKLGATD
jgi:HPt (histidine-containing phosphotransfer) domain-containing protein